MISVTHLGEDYSTIEVDGEEFEASLGLGEAIHKMIGQCAYCGESMHTIIRCHHHTEEGKDVTTLPYIEDRSGKLVVRKLEIEGYAMTAMLMPDAKMWQFVIPTGKTLLEKAMFDDLVYYHKNVYNNVDFYAGIENIRKFINENK